MNKYLMLLLFFCLASGCKKDLNYVYAFNLNGTAEHGDIFTAAYQYDTVAGLKEFAANFYIGSATDTNYVQVSFSGGNYITPGNYYTGINNAGNTVCSFAYNNLHKYYANANGILQVVQIDTVAHAIKGNFQFKAINVANIADTVTITSGSFAIAPYVIQ